MGYILFNSANTKSLFDFSCFNKSSSPNQFKLIRYRPLKTIQSDLGGALPRLVMRASEFF